jgi:hypothetical protein
LLSLLEVWQVRICPLVIWIDFQVVPRQDDQSGRGELFPCDLDIDIGRLTFTVGRAAGEEPPGYEFVNSFLIRLQVAGVRCRVNRGMCFIVLLAIARSRKVSVHESVHDTTEQDQLSDLLVTYLDLNSPLGEPSPSRISDLFPNQTQEIEILVELIRFRSRVTEKPLLIELFGYLQAWIRLRISSSRIQWLRHSNSHQGSSWALDVTVAIPTSAVRLS